jgi:NAD(P)-dependent dehydrogenase (short-subunit alcohol dehydrogenase family)
VIAAAAICAAGPGDGMDLGLSGKVAIVTGGSRGIGKAIAGALAGEGAALVIAARNQAALAAAARQLSDQAGAAGAKILPVRCDTGSSEEVDRLVSETIEYFGRVDVLVNCAGRPGRLAAPPALAEIAEADVWDDLNVKVLGYLRCIRAVAPHMAERGGGRIVNVIGMAARQTGGTVRSMRNAAITAMTKNLADELGPQGIAVCAVHPGFVRTEATPGALAARAAREHSTAEDVERRLAGGNAIGRIVESAEVASVVTFLASPRAIAVNGDVIAASGGARGWIHY